MKKSKRIKHQSVGQRLIGGLTELRDALKTAEPLETRFTVRTVELPDDPTSYDAAGVLALRRRMGASQVVFAKLVGVSTILVQSWEQGKRKPSQLACRLLDEIKRDPERWVKRLRPSESLATS